MALCINSSILAAASSSSQVERKRRPESCTTGQETSHTIAVLSAMMVVEKPS